MNCAKLCEMKTSRAFAVRVPLFLFLLPPFFFFHVCNARTTTSLLLRAKIKGREESADSGGGGGGGVLYETRYFSQTLDHFNFEPQGYATFQQKYLVNDTYWGGKGAPIFVYTGNEGGIELFAQNTGFMFDVAPSFKALLVFIEHRYYGESIPFGGGDEVFNNANALAYLSSTQALADFATLIIDLKKNLSSEDSPVLAFGGSYGGMLAAWFRLKYPHIVIGALASSAPILQFDDLVSPYTFYNIITNDFRTESESCYRTIKRSWKELEEASHQEGGPEKLAKAFKLCSAKTGEIEELMGWIATAFIYGAMTDYPTPANFLTPLPAYPVKQMCKAIDNPTTSNGTFDRLYGAMNIYYNYTGNETCFELLDQASPLGAGGWFWQTCTEMVLPTGGSTDESMFPPNKNNYTEQVEDCRSYYGITPRPHWITTEFGGHHITRMLKRFGSNVIFFNGLRDPWSGGGVLKTINPSLIAIVEPQGAHHVDLRFSTEEDPTWLTNVRKKEIKIIEGWLKQYYADLKY